jgi:hypothetical protein
MPWTPLVKTKTFARSRAKTVKIMPEIVIGLIFTFHPYTPTIILGPNESVNDSNISSNWNVKGECGDFLARTRVSYPHQALFSANARFSIR